MRGHLADVINRGKFYLNQIRGFDSVGVEFLASPQEREVAVNTWLELPFSLWLSHDLLCFHDQSTMQRQRTYSSVTLQCGLMWQNRLRRLCRSNSATIVAMPWNWLSDRWIGKASSIISTLNLGLSMLLRGKAERFRDILACAPTGSRM